MSGRILGVLGVARLLVHWGWVPPPPLPRLPAGATALVGPSHPVSGRSTTPACLALFWLFWHTLPSWPSKVFATLAGLTLLRLNEGDVDTLDVD